MIISNCVINLSPDKDAVFRESLRVLRAGRPLPRVRRRAVARSSSDAEKDDLALWAGCASGALLETDYLARLQTAGFDEGARRQPQQDRREAVVQRDDLGVQAGAVLLRVVNGC